MAFPTGYSKYQEITIDHTKVSADLTDYVIYVNLAHLVKAGADIFDTCRSDGGDIRATKSDGTTQLATELVAIDTTAKTGELHIKFTGTLSSSTDTVIRIYYNGTDTTLSVSDTYGRNAVWSDYYAVWHFEGAAASGGKVTDSTGNGRTLTENHAPRSITGRFGSADGAYDFDGVAGQTSSNAYDWLELVGANVMSDIGASAFSMSCWWKPDIATTSAFHQINLEQNSATGRPQAYLLYVTDKRPSYSLEPNTSGGSNIQIATNTVEVGTWSYLMGGRNTSNYPFVFLDGEERVGATVESGAFVTPNAPFYLNRRFNTHYSSAKRYGDGSMDEVRIRFSDLSGDWVITEHNNQNSPSTFYAIGNEQGGSTSVTVNPVAQVLTSSIQTYAVKVGVRQSPVAQVVTASLPVPTVKIPKTVSPAVQSIVASIPTYAVSVGGNVSVPVSVQVMTLSVPAYSIFLGVIFSPTAQSLTFSTPTPTLSLGTGVSITPEAQSATFTLPTPIITTERSTIVDVVAQILTLTIPTLVKVGGVWTKKNRVTDADWGRTQVSSADWGRRSANDT